MKSKVLSLFTLAALAVSLVGCNIPGIAPGVLRLGVSSGAAYSLLKYPQAAPAVRASAEIICSEANGTNLAPAAIYAAVNAYGQQTPESTLIVNSALGLYTLVWNGYGAEAVNNSPNLKLYLSATCDGLHDALGGVPITPASPMTLRSAPVNKNWPHVNFPQ